MRFALPAIESPADAVAATGAILSAVVTGQAAPGEAQTIVAVIDTNRAWSSSRTTSGV